MNKRKPQIEKIASERGVTERTVRNWKAAGAPLSDTSALSVWLASRRQPPQSAPAPVRTGPPPQVSLVELSIPVDARHRTGAAAALKRLEAQEVADYAYLETAARTGDELQIRLARDRWLKTSESLRKYDLAVEQARRDSGELVAREEMLRVCHDLHDAIHHAMFTFTDIIPTLEGCTKEQMFKILKSVEQTVRAAIYAHIARSRKTPLPAWMIKAVALGAFPLPDVTLEPLGKFMAIAIKTVAEHEREIIRVVDQSTNRQRNEEENQSQDQKSTTL